MEIAPLHGAGSYAWTHRHAAAYHRLMRVAPLLLLVALAAAPVAAQVTRATRSDDFSRILVVTAHPDDESLVAPLLGSFCGTHSTCKLLVMTHGENGDCMLDDDDACNNLGDTRAAELTAAAAMLHAQLESWSLPDAYDNVIDEWGGRALMTSRIATEIESFRPTVVITFDPAHGTTCHPAHRAVADLVVSSAGPHPVLFIETRARVNEDDGAYTLTRAITAASHVYLFDMTESWHFMIDDMNTHTSQFTDDAVESVMHTPDKMLVLMPSHAVAAYDSPCAE